MPNVIKEGQLAYDLSERAKELHAVDGFNPREYLRESELKNGNSMTRLDIAVQKLWFHLEVENGRIETAPHEIARDHAIFSARVYFDDSDKIKATGYASCYITEDPDFGRSFVELAETYAIGRALTNAGFGSQFCDIAGINEPEPSERGNESTNASTSDNGETPTVAPEKADSGNTKKKDSQAQTIEAEQPKKYVPDSSLSLEELVASMPVEYATQIPVTVGFLAGKTLGQISIEKPQSLMYYIKQDNIPKILKAGTQVLLNAANARQAKAG